MVQVHPRVCGEYAEDLDICDTNTGSPPRMRGILSDQHSDSLRFRFTPAYAGNISDSLQNVIMCQVHPRVCGEYYKSLEICVFFIGSPPRMRGICGGNVNAYYK